jgi:hypothetical protein
MVVGAGTVNPRAESTSAAVGHESAAVPAVAVGVAVVTAAVGVAVCPGALVAGVEPLLAPPQAASASESSDAAPAARVRR